MNATKTHRIWLNAITIKQFNQITNAPKLSYDPYHAISVIPKMEFSSFLWN